MALRFHTERQTHIRHPTLRMQHMLILKYLNPHTRFWPMRHEYYIMVRGKIQHFFTYRLKFFFVKSSEFPSKCSSHTRPLRFIAASDGRGDLIIPQHIRHKHAMAADDLRRAAKWGGFLQFSEQSMELMQKCMDFSGGLCYNVRVVPRGCGKSPPSDT